MQNMFKVVADGNPKQVEMTQDVLDMAIAITSYISNNFMESDFFTLGSTDEDNINRFLDVLKDAKARASEDGSMISIDLDEQNSHLCEQILWYGRNFGDDIPELESLHDSICDIEIS